jgi:sodium transport system ATP-binding protein
MSEAEKLCDCIGIIHHGRLRAEGTLEELRAKFHATDLEDVFVRSLEGAP